MKKVFILFIFICVAFSATAADPTPTPIPDTIIDVTVIDADTGAPLAGVLIQAVGSDSFGMPVLFSGYTDSNGYFYKVISGLRISSISFILDQYQTVTVYESIIGTLALSKLTGPFTLTIDSEFAYLVELDPPGGVYTEATHVTVSAGDEINPDGSGYYFVEWQGAGTGTAPILGLLVTGEIVLTPVYEWRDPLPVPVITAVSPASGPAGTAIVITGYNFEAEDNIVLLEPSDGSDYHVQTLRDCYDGTTLRSVIFININPKCWDDEPRCTDSSIATAPGMYDISVSNGVHTSNTILFEVTEPEPTAVPTNTPALTGDVNADGTVTIVDALMVAQHYVGLSPLNFNPASADVDCDGSVTIIDALMIAQYYVGLISGFNC